MIIKKPGKDMFAHRLFKLCEEEDGFFVLMGDPATPKRICYADLKEKLGEGIYELPIPKNFINFVSHGASIIIDKNVDIEEAIEGILYSFRFPKVCKVPSCIYIHSEIYPDFEEEFIEKVKNLKASNVLDKK